MKEVSKGFGGLYKNGAEAAEQLKPFFELHDCILPAPSAPASKSELHSKSPPRLLPRGKEARADGKGGGQFSAVKKFCVHQIYVECTRGASAVPRVLHLAFIFFFQCAASAYRIPSPTAVSRCVLEVGQAEHEVQQICCASFRMCACIGPS